MRRLSLRLRIVLAIAGLCLILFACAALVYSLTPPVEHLREQVPVTPTLFAPPQSSVDWPQSLVELPGVE